MSEDDRTESSPPVESTPAKKDPVEIRDLSPKDDPLSDAATESPPVPPPPPPKRGILREFLQFLREEWIWWVTPVVIILVLMAALIWYGEGATIAPFFYAIF